MGKKYAFKEGFHKPPRADILLGQGKTLPRPEGSWASPTAELLPLTQGPTVG
jgi:hypothetical protein